MSNCPDLCTAAKCAELEQRIEELQFQLDGVLAALNQHIYEDIPLAHGYEPIVNVNMAIDEGDLIVDVTVDGQSDFSDVPLPDNVNPSVTMDIFEPTPGEYVFKVGVNGETDEDTLLIEPPLINLEMGITSLNEVQTVLQFGEEFYDASVPLPDLDVAVGVFENGNGELAIAVQVGENRDEDTFYLPEPEATEHIVSNLNLFADYANDILTITVSDGESQATATVFIDANVINNFGGGGGTDVSCENLSSELTNCCNNLSAEFQDCCNLMLNAIAQNFDKIQQVENAVTIDITHTINSDYKCEFEKDDNGDIIPTYATHTFTEKEYEGKGLIGIHESLKKVHEHLDEIYINSCKSIPPELKLDLSKGLEQLCQDNNLQTADDFDNEQGFFDYIRDALLNLAGSSITRMLVNRLSFVPGSPVSFVIGTTVDFALSYLVERGTAAETEGLKTVCEAIAELEEQTITIIASESDIGRVEGNVLILHFVTEDNYPKRQRGSNKRPIRIPAPRENYDWDADFLNIRWETGNQFAKLKLEGWKPGITGWFKDAAAANACFDQLIGLTTAAEIGRVIPVHTNPRTDIVVKTTRPYRAFIAREVNPGEGETLTKYYPTDEPQSN